MRCDIFCRVVDNFGDIGVCWRLARQLAYEHGYEVQLWVDDLPSFRRLQRDVEPERNEQTIEGIRVRRWPAVFPRGERLDLVIEAFACALPEGLLERMAEQPSQPVWVNLEYLSAEAWVESCHRMQSRHPRLPLTQHFFFPGFTRATGGLLREKTLIERRDAFLRDRAQRNDFWRGLGITAPVGDELRISLFCYETAALSNLIELWSNHDRAIVCCVPEGKALHSLRQALPDARLTVGARLTIGQLTLHVIPFIEQSAYDRLLWACDLNIVRGEDSFVRAQWAGRPFIWHIYPQDEAAHLEKLNAFIQRYTASAALKLTDTLRAALLEFNHNRFYTETWKNLSGSLVDLRGHALAWAENLAEQRDLASQLANFHQACVK